MKKKRNRRTDEKETDKEEREKGTKRRR